MLPLTDEYLNALSRRIVNNCHTDDASPQHVRSGVISWVKCLPESSASAL